MDAGFAHEGDEDRLRQAEERLRTEASSRAGEARLLLALEAARMGTGDWDLRTGQIALSQTACALFGLANGGAAVTVQALQACIHPEDRRPVEAALRLVHPSRPEFDFEFRTTAAVTRWLAVRGRAFFEGGSTAVRVTGVAVDITARKREEDDRRALEDHLRQVQRMEAVGQLAGGVAHDFNNLLTVIAGYSELLLRMVPPETPMRRELEEISAAAEHGSVLTHQLLAFSRRQATRPEHIDLHAVVRQANRMLERLVGENVALRTELDPSPAAVLADAGQMQQVLVNLVVNARDAMPQGGTLTIGTHVTHDTVELKVVDTGTGMPPEVLARIWEPFFTTKRPGKGTGLGLPTVADIVKGAGGTITVESEPEQGTTFAVRLPRSKELPARAQMAPMEDGPRGTESVLLVEDAESLRRLVARTLELRGYKVTSAADPFEALELARTQPRPLDLLVTDVVMPGLSGPQLAAAVREQHPEVRVIFMSGHSDEALISLHGGDEMGAVLHKPFSPQQLARRVRDTLDEG